MDQSIQARGRRVVTPAVTLAAAFAVLTAMFSVAFVTARGGLQLPVAPTSSLPAVAVASVAASLAASGLPPSAIPVATAESSSPASTVAPSSPGPSAEPMVSPIPTPIGEPSAVPSPLPSGPRDPLLALPACPDHPGCYVYTVRRGDTFSSVSDRFGLLLWITSALNPEVADTKVIVVGQTLYLGHDPTARLDPCPNGEPCHLYIVRPGDTLSTIAGRYGLSVQKIEALNPGLGPARIVTGDTLRLPLYQG